MYFTHFDVIAPFIHFIRGRLLMGAAAAAAAVGLPLAGHHQVAGRTQIQVITPNFVQFFQFANVGFGPHIVHQKNGHSFARQSWQTIMISVFKNKKGFLIKKFTSLLIMYEEIPDIPGICELRIRCNICRLVLL